MADMSLEGKKIRLVDFPGQVFSLHYAGWEDQWIVKNQWGQDMLRVNESEVYPYLIENGPPVTPKYPNYLMEKVRQQIGLESYDASRDAEINEMPHDTVLNSCLIWEGIIGYTFTLKNWIKDIYGVTLE